MGLVQTPRAHLIDPTLLHISHPTVTGDFFAFDQSVTFRFSFSLRLYEKVINIYPFMSTYHRVYDFTNARLIYLLILNCIMNNLMCDTLSGMSFLSSCALALFTPRTWGACSRRILLRWLCLPGSCKQDSISLPSICTVFQRATEASLIGEQNNPQLLA